MREVTIVVNNRPASDTAVEVKDLSKIMNPRTYFETVKKLLMCPGSSGVRIEASKIN